MAMIHTFKDEWLDNYYFLGKYSKHIPSNLDTALNRKLNIIHIANDIKDLKVPPGNRFEYLRGTLNGWCSIRVNKQYRLIFQWNKGLASEIYLDAHVYR